MSRLTQAFAFIGIAGICLGSNLGSLPSTQWDDEGHSALSIRVPVSSAPDWQAFPTGSNTFAYCFPDGSDTYLHFSYQLSHRYVVGTDFDIHFHWAGDSDPDATLTARMVVDYTIAAPGGTFPASTQVSGGVTIEDDEQNKHQVDDSTTVTGSVLGISSVMIGRIWRDGDGTTGTDDYQGDVCFLGIDSHIQVDRGGGSAQESTK
jgi:hypothetical protein